jgi:FkbM family methyltransferase
MGRRILTHVLQVFIVAIPLTVIIVLLFPMHALAVVLKLKGRSCCTIQQTVDARRMIDERLGREGAYANHARVAARDGSIQLWDIAGARYWAPISLSRGSLADILVEQQMHEYGPLPAGGIILDCGAHIGLFTKQALQDGAAKVVAIEPDPTHLECLRRNFSDEIRAGRVTIYPEGVWNKRDVLVLYNHAQPGASFVKDDDHADPGTRVPVTTIDTIVAELRLPRVDMIKMDIEGSERQAIRGARETLRRFGPRLVTAIYHFPDDPQAIATAVAETDPAYRLIRSTCWAFNQPVIAPYIASFGRR